MLETIKMGIRNLGRNKRRSLFSALALAIGLALLLLIAGFFRGEMSGAINLGIRLQSGHLQVRAKSYEEGKTSLKWEDLVQDPDLLAAQIASLQPVRVATPRLYASGIVSAGDRTAGVRIMGIDPPSAGNDPYRDGMLSGDFLDPDDRSGVLIGQALAEKLDLNSGDQISLSINTANGDISEQLFIIRGVYSTQTSAFDGVTVFMPLAKAQSITQTEKHASTIFILLQNKEQAPAVAQALQAPNLQVLTWEQMNELVTQMDEMSSVYIYFIYLIVLGITVTVIINTLLMSVFERTREIGILAAIGMKSRRIMAIFLTETSLLALGGVALGMVLGVLVVAFFNRTGFYIGDMGLTGILLGDRVYADLAVNDLISLALMAFVISLFAGLIPAVLAARMEPVAALRAEK